uniref:Uncharacterized protein n=1 Tax=Fagus sylvatica TaxID=28930 RepID=A0A2N9G0K5_FAGSY
MMSKKRLGGRRPHWPNHGKSCVIFPFFPPTTPKPELAVPTLEINGRSNFDLLHWRRLWEPHFPEFWHERGLFPSFQAPPSTVSLGTRASKHPIEQPPQPLDRSSLDLQNPERSSSLEAPRALTRHWSSRLSCPRATTRRRHIRTPEHGLLGFETVKRHHHWSPLQPIYHLDGGQVTIGEATRLHAPISPPESMAHAPIAVATLEAQIGAFRAPIQETGTTFGLLRRTIYCLPLESLSSDWPRASTRR